MRKLVSSWARAVRMTAIRVVISGVAALSTIGPVAATPLVTAEEAQLPADNSRLRSGIERGLDIVPFTPRQNRERSNRRLIFG